MKTNKLFIRKVPGYKIQGMRINSVNDIPSFLQKYVRVDEKNIFLHFGKETIAPLNSVIIYDYLEPCLLNCSLFETLPEDILEKDGVFYKKSPVMQAAKIEEQLPDFMKNARITYYKDSYVVSIRGGVALIKPNREGYFCLYGYSKKDESYPLIDVISPPSYKDYIVCDEQGNYVREL